MAINHMHLASRCTAHSKRTGKPCRSPAVRGFTVCRMHGARGGAPRGERNGRWKHGRFACDAIESRRTVRQIVRDMQQTLRKL